MRDITGTGAVAGRSGTGVRGQSDTVVVVVLEVVVLVVLVVVVEVDVLVEVAAMSVGDERSSEHAVSVRAAEATAAVTHASRRRWRFVG